MILFEYFIWVFGSGRGCVIFGIIEVIIDSGCFFWLYVRLVLFRVKRIISGIIKLLNKYM